MERKQVIAVDAFIHRDGKVLIAKRSEKCKLFAGMYELPGGKIQFGETPEHTIKREIREELGIRIRPIKPIHAHSSIVYEGTVHLTDLIYLTELIGDVSEIELKEHDDVAWIGQKDIDNFEMSENTREAIIRGFEVISSR